MFKRIFLVVFTVLFSVSSLFAGVDIPTECQVKNRKPGYCMWASTETICNYLGYKEGKGLVDWYAAQPWNNGAWPEEVESQLKEFKIPFKANYEVDFKALCKYLNEDKPVLIAFKKDSALGPHAVTAVDFKDGKLFFVDSNHPGHLYSFAEVDFKDQWAGWFIVLLPRV